MEEKAVVETPQKERGDTFQIIVFKQGNEEYAIHIDQIKEVVLTPPVTRIPQTPAYIKGVANIRGNIIAIVDLEEKFGLEKSENQQGNNYTLVISSDTFKLGILVKEVPNTLAVSDSDVEESMNIMGDQQGDQNYIRGIVKKGNRLIVLIDVFKVVSENELKNVNHGKTA